MAEEMAGTVAMPTCPVTQPERPAGAVTIVSTEEGWDYLRRLSNAVFPLLQQSKPMRQQDRAMMMAVKMHLDTLWRSLEAFRGYSSTTTVDGPLVGHHSWLHVEDIAP